MILWHHTRNYSQWRREVTADLQTYKERTEIPQEFTWDLESIFSRNELWEQDYQAIQNSLPELEALQGTLAQSGKALLSVLQKRDAIFEQLERLYTYASMRKDEDTADSQYIGMADRAMQLVVRASTAASFTEPEILALPEATLNQFVQETPELALYQQQLRDLNRQRPHIRSAEIEAILAAAGEVTEAPESVFSM